MMIEGSIVEGLPSPLPEAARASIAALPRGRYVGFPPASLDRTGVPVWFVSLFLDDTGLPGAMPNGIGYDATDDEAIIGAVAEISENLFPSLTLRDAPRERGSYADLARALGVRAVVDPLTLCLPAGSPVDRDTPLEGVRASRGAHGETVLVPVDVAAVEAFELTDGYVPFTTLITNGLGAGPDIDFALGHGLLELLQRDGNGLLFRALDHGVLLDLDAPLQPYTRALLDRFERLGIEVMPKYATDEFGFANLYVFGRDGPGFAPPAPIALSACGEACDPDRERALQKALLEFAAARVRKTFAHGPRETAARIAPRGYVDGFIERALPSLDVEEGRALRAMLDWAGRSGAEIAGFLAGTVHAVTSGKPFSTPPTSEALSGRDRGRLGRERLDAAGFDVLYVDFSPRDRSVAVVKAIVPGLEVETMSYYRVGERNARKLIERGHPLVRFGRPSKTLRPVRLAPESLDRFGGQPLFDVALADGLVGPLYPLYREPEVHHAAFRFRAQAAAASSSRALA